MMGYVADTSAEGMSLSELEGVGGNKGVGEREEEREGEGESKGEGEGVQADERGYVTSGSVEV